MSLTRQEMFNRLAKEDLVMYRRVFSFWYDFVAGRVPDPIMGWGEDVNSSRYFQLCWNMRRRDTTTGEVVGPYIELDFLVGGGFHWYITPGRGSEEPEPRINDAIFAALRELPRP